MARFQNRDSRMSRRCLMKWEATGAAPVFDVQNATATAPAEIMLYDEIGFYGVTAGDFVSALQQIGPGPLNLRINSPGGDVFDGMAMFNALRAHNGTVSVFVDGLAASAASWIMLGGATVSASDASFVMIHNSWTFAMGDRRDMADSAAVLGKMDAMVAGFYAAKAGTPAAGFSAQMDAETWLTGQEAKDVGLVDEVTTGGKQPSNLLRPGVYDRAPRSQIEQEPAADAIQAGAARLRLLRMFGAQVSSER